MRSKSSILLVVALGCGMVASVGISQVVSEKSASTIQVKLVEILVATKDIDVSERITADNIRLEKWPEDRLPEGAITKLDEVEHRFANQRLYEGEPILQRKLMDSVESAAVKIPIGHRVFDMSVDNKTGGTGYILPGDRVDVIGFFPATQAGKIGQTQTVLRAVRVFGIDGNTVRDAKSATADNKKVANTIQLLIQDSQLEAMTTAAAMGQLRVSLCPPGVVTPNKEENIDTGAAFLTWLKENHGSQEPEQNNTQANKPEITSTTPKVNTPAPTPVNQGREIAVITPRGVSRYQLGNNGELPRLIESPNPNGNAPAVPTSTDVEAADLGDSPVDNPLQDGSESTDAPVTGGNNAPTSGTGSTSPTDGLQPSDSPR